MAQRFTKKDVSTSLRNSESGMVDQVMLSTNSEGQRFVKLRVRDLLSIQHIWHRLHSLVPYLCWLICTTTSEAGKYAHAAELCALKG